MAMAIPNLIGGLTQICAAIVSSRIHQGREETDSEKIQKENERIHKQNEGLTKLIHSLKNKKNNNNEECCCGSVDAIRKNYNIFIYKSTKKEAYEAALHFPRAKGAVLHYHNKIDNIPHFHPTFDVEGKKKIPGIHIRFPK